MAINVAASAFVITTQQMQSVVSHTPAAPRNVDLDVTFYLDAGELTITVAGTWSNVSVAASALSTSLSITGSFYDDVLSEADATLSITLSLSADFILELSKSNWVKWSNIGSLSFTIGRDNVAGERPMTWKGSAHVIRKLGKSVIVYGDSGISIMTPHDFKWGYDVVSGIGIHSRMAICGNDKVHYFVDAKSRLCRMMEKLEILGYDEFIEALGDHLVLSYDEHLQRVFICDGQYGYVYSASDKSLGRGPGNITGWSTDLIAAAGTVSSTPFEICTDIYDIGTRKDKTIMEVELGIDATNEVYVAIDWRKDKTAAFATTPWTRVNPNGRANLPCWGREFRIRIKQTTYEAFKLDYIKVLGQLHNYSFLDSFLRGRQV